MIFLHRQNNISYKADIFGVEIDLRRNNKGLILNHDLLQFDVKYPLLTKKLHLFKDVPIIFNIKESNLEELIIDMFDKMDNGGGYRYYFLDSQIPDILRLSKNGYQGKFIIRISDVETYNQKLIDISKPKYVWLDYSQFDKFDIKNYQKFILEVNYNLKDDIIPILASPELYNLSYVNLIHDIQNILPKKDFSICTKRPDLWNLYV